MKNERALVASDFLQMICWFGRKNARQAAHEEHQRGCTSLCCARSGSRVCVLEISGCELEASKLRDLGVREGALVTVVKHGDPLLVRVDEARFGIGEAAATNVLCEYVAK